MVKRFAVFNNQVESGLLNLLSERECMRTAVVGYRIFSGRSRFWSSIHRTQRKPLFEMEEDLQYAWYLLSSHSRQSHYGTHMFYNTSVAGLTLFLHNYEENREAIIITRPEAYFQRTSLLFFTI